MATCSWPLGDGTSLDFDVFGSNDGWRSVGGLYIFAYYDGQHWRPLYIGQTDDFSSRLPLHERLDEAIRLGATHIHTLVVQHAENRDTWERMLIDHLQPRMNVQFR